MEEGRIGGGSSSTETETEAKVKSIFVYPIKSCRGISLSQAPLTPTGNRTHPISYFKFKDKYIPHWIDYTSAFFSHARHLILRI